MDSTWERWQLNYITILNKSSSIFQLMQTVMLIYWRANTHFLQLPVVGSSNSNGWECACVVTSDSRASTAHARHETDCFAFEDRVKNSVANCPSHWVVSKVLRSNSCSNSCTSCLTWTSLFWNSKNLFLVCVAFCFCPALHVFCVCARTVPGGCEIT